jgi:hypothetical protein
MGWKRVKQHYRISHVVHVSAGVICIGSVVDLEKLLISAEGVIIKRPTLCDIELDRYLREMDEEPDTLVRLVTTPDEFDMDKSVPVYTFEGGRILEKQCEAMGWPGVTHDGMLLYETRFSRDKGLAVARAKADAQGAMRAIQADIEGQQLELKKLQSALAEAEADLAQLNAEHPNEEWLHG